MEDDLFEWEDWQLVDDTWEVIFTNCTLKTKIGQFNPGSKIERISIDFEMGTMQLIFNGLRHEFHVKLVIAQ